MGKELALGSRAERETQACGKQSQGAPTPSSHPKAVPTAFLFWVAVWEPPMDPSWLSLPQCNPAENSWGCGFSLLNHLSLRHLLFALLMLPEWRPSASFIDPNSPGGEENRCLGPIPHLQNQALQQL